MKTKILSAFAIIITAVFICISFQSCNEKVKPIDPAYLEGYWVLKSLNGNDAKSLFEGALPTIQFDFQKNTVSGTSGCNRYNGPFSLENNVFRASDLASTQMLCVSKNEEGKFKEEITKPLTISIENGILTFTNDQKKVVLEFEKGEAPKTFEEKLAGTWNLKTMTEKPVAEFFKGEDAKIPTLTFEMEEGKIGGHAGCNGYGSAFKIDNGLLIVEPIASTMMACPNIQSEAEYIKYLSDTSGINITNENILQIIKKGDIFLEFTKG